MSKHVKVHEALVSIYLEETHFWSVLSISSVSCTQLESLKIGCLFFGSKNKLGDRRRLL